MINQICFSSRSSLGFFIHETPSPAGVGPIRGKFWTSPQRVIQPFQSQTKQLQPSVPAVLAPLNQPPTPNDQQRKTMEVPDKKSVLKYLSEPYRAVLSSFKSSDGSCKLFKHFPICKSQNLSQPTAIAKAKYQAANYTNHAI